MRRLLAAIAAMSFLYPAGAAEPAAPAPSISSKYRIDPTYEDGRLLRLKTPRGVTRYEYGRDGKLSRKILPKGVTIDYYYDRAGKLVESRSSSGLVRTSQYDRQGMLAQIVGSDGYVLNASGPKGNRTIVITGPKAYRVDLTPMINMARKTYASKMMGKKRPAPMLIGGGGSGCGYSWDGTISCEESDGGDYGDGGAYGDGWYDDGWGAAGDDDYGAAEDDNGSGWTDDGGDSGWAEDGGGEDDAQYGAAEDDDGGYGNDSGEGGGEPPGADTGGPWPPERSASPGNNGFMRCMVDCDRADVYMKQYCRVAAANKPVCDEVALRTYFSCDRRCRYENY